MAATSTNDTKRSEDVRVRIAALSEAPRDWRALLPRWARQNRRFRTELDGAPAPDRNDELLLYQTLVGTFPDDGGPRSGGVEWDAYVARIVAYMQKAVREAKVHTSWTHMDAEYEEAVRRFTESVLGSAEFVSGFAPFARRIADAGRISSLSQVALKIASPGPCDVYQGCELWDLSLVDPDNRRPVDFGRRAALLDDLRARLDAGPAERVALAREVSTPDALRDGRAKLLLVHQGLRLRRERPGVFLDGSYVPLEADGPDARHVVAFARRHPEGVVVCVAPRLVLSRAERPGPWQARVALPPGAGDALRDVVTGVRVHGNVLEVEQLYADFPVALLASPPEQA